MTSTPQCVIQLKVPRPVDISVTVKTELQRKDKEREMSGLTLCITN